MCQARRIRVPGTAEQVVRSVGRSVAALAERQRGLVTFNQLRRLGLSRGAVQHWISVGRLHRVHVGVFAVGHAAIDERGCS
jgi:hypothetical protein